MPIIALLLLTACAEAAEEPERTERTGDIQPTATPTSVADQDTPDAPAPVKQPEPANSVGSRESGEIDIPHHEFSSGNSEIYRLNLETGEQSRVTANQKQYMHPAWSPDGSMVAATIENMNELGTQIEVLDIDSGTGRELDVDVNRGGITWSPDGTTIAFGARETGEIHLIEADGTNHRQLTRQDAVEPIVRYGNASSPAWSPDGSRIIFSARHASEDAGPIGVSELWAVDVGGDGMAEKLTDSSKLQKSDPVWLPHGDRIAFSGYEVDSGETWLYTVDRRGGDLQRYALADGKAAEPHWSPDNRRVVFVQERSHIEDIYVANADGTEIEQLSDGDHDNTSPRWSLDGTELLFISNRDPRLAVPCSFGVEITLGEPEPPETLVWTSTQVVIGQISEKHEPVFADPHWFASGPCLEIVTEYTVEVETRFRGTDSDSLTVRVPGGTIDPYQAEIANTPTYQPGERVLLFLFDAPESDLLPPAYGIDSRRSWSVSDEASGRIRKALEDGPPEELGTRLIPPEVAPITE